MTTLRQTNLRKLQELNAEIQRFEIEMKEMEEVRGWAKRAPRATRPRLPSGGNSIKAAIISWPHFCDRRVDAGTASSRRGTRHVSDPSEHRLGAFAGAASVSTSAFQALVRLSRGTSGSAEE